MSRRVRKATRDARNIDWDAVASYYDAYVQTDLDIDFFRRHARDVGGPVLELMCGTGRITLPLLEAGFEVTAVDSSHGLLERLRAKLRERNLYAEVVQADVRSLDLGRAYPLVMIGFHAFAEVLGAASRLRAMRAIRPHIAPGGRLVLTLHNPVVRAASAHADWRSMGVFALASGRSLEVTSRWDVDRDTARICGVQRYRELASGACVKETSLPIMFDLVDRTEVASLAQKVGLTIARVSAKYDGSPVDEATSPFLLFEMTPTAGGQGRPHVSGPSRSLR